MTTGKALFTPMLTLEQNFYPLFDQVCSRSLSPLLYMTPLTQIVVARPEPFMASFSYGLARRAISWFWRNLLQCKLQFNFNIQALIS